MNKDYRPAEIESRHYARWESAGYFAPSGSGEPYCIVIPPPNVTGTLHMGHAFQHTLMDVLIRYHRMRGDNTLWQPGTDHAGIATQMVVERQLNARRHERATTSAARQFVERVWAVEGRIGRHDHAARCAASARRSTGRASASRWTTGCRARCARCSCACYEEGLIYRGKRLVNWDPVLHDRALGPRGASTEESSGKLWHLRYPVERRRRRRSSSRRRGPRRCSATPRSRCIRTTSATARSIGKTRRAAARPAARSRSSPTTTSIREFGTGAVKITPAHDFNDYEVGLRHEPADDQHLRRRTRR